LRKQKKVDSHKRWLLAKMVLVMAACIMTAGCGRILKDEDTKEGVFQAAQESTYEDRAAEADTEGAPHIIFVHVCGEVKKPGLYSFEEGQRINDAVEAAGGFTDQANKEAVNLAIPLEDGQQIRIPDKSESYVGTSQASGPSSGDSGKGSGKVNINTASVDELASLSGIGESKAAAILSYREEHGSFSRQEDIMKVPGIGEGTYNRIKDSISV
jgi:competence protein ComEA